MNCSRGTTALRRMLTDLWCLAVACVSFLYNATAATPPVNEQTGFFAFNEENDSLADAFGSDQDRHYTQGLKLTLFGGDDFWTNGTEALNRFFPSIGIKTDRPFAGWLYTGAIYQRREQMAVNFAQLESFEINLGIVGPGSLADESQ